MSWLFGGEASPKETQSFRWDTGSSDTPEEKDKVIALLKKRYEDIAYKCAEETTRKDQILKKLKVLEQKDASVGVCLYLLRCFFRIRLLHSSCVCDTAALGRALTARAKAEADVKAKDDLLVKSQGVLKQLQSKVAELTEKYENAVSEREAPSGSTDPETAASGSQPETSTKDNNLPGDGVENFAKEDTKRGEQQAEVAESTAAIIGDDGDDGDDGIDGEGNNYGDAGNAERGESEETDSEDEDDDDAGRDDSEEQKSGELEDFELQAKKQAETIEALQHQVNNNNYNR
jgi:hypothetical protein